MPASLKTMIDDGAEDEDYLRRTQSGGRMTVMLSPLARLPQEFRAKAKISRSVAGAETAAYIWEQAAQAVEQRLGEAFLEPLSLDQAETESGYTRNHLSRMLRESTLPNSGTTQDPRILRKHLPRKPGHGVDQGELQPASSRMQAARAVIEGDD